MVVDRLPAAGETVTGGRFAQHGGGKSANQAVAAARLGASVALVGAVGADAMGDEAIAALEAEGIDVSGVARLDEPTGVALIVVDAAGENQIAVASGANAALDPEHVSAQLARLLRAEAEPAVGPSEAPAATPGAAAATPGAAAATPRAAPPRGVVLLGHEVSPDVVAAAATAADAAGWPVVLNPAPARELPDAQLAVLTPNASEAAQLTGEQDPEAAARVLVERTGAAVLITLGAQGALLLEPGEHPQHLPATQVDVVDTTGAGDTVNGALAAELAAGRPLVDAARFALRAAALSTTAPGARGGMPRRAEVDA
ncbi:MAG TPA: ribokinase [Solirubrobacter sp.]|nr:ribokinase [Solirubrobacter sp.]